MTFFILLILSFSCFGGEFETLVDKSVKRHFQYIADQNSYHLTDVEKKRAFSRFLPSVELTRSHTKFEQDNELSEYYRSSLDLRMNVFSFGSDISNTKRVEYKKHGLKNKLKLTTFELEREITNSIFRVIESKLLVEIYNKIVAIRKQSLKIANKRYESGQLSLQDKQKVQIDLNNAKSNRADQVISQQRQIQKFKELTGKEQYKEKWPWENIKVNYFLDKDIEIKNHPLNKYAHSLKMASKYQKSSDLLSFFGGVDFVVSSGVNQFDSGEVVDNRLYIGFSVPLFNKFNDYYSYKRSAYDYQFQKSFETYQKRKVNSTFDQSLMSLKASYETFLERKKNLKLSQKLFKNSQQQFRKGRLTVNELLIEQDRLLRSQVLANSGILNYHKSIVDYCHSTGRSIIKDCIL